MNKYQLCRVIVSALIGIAVIVLLWQAVVNFDAIVAVFTDRTLYDVGPYINGIISPLVVFVFGFGLIHCSDHNSKYYTFVNSPKYVWLCCAGMLFTFVTYLTSMFYSRNLLYLLSLIPAVIVLTSMAFYVTGSKKVCKLMWGSNDE